MATTITHNKPADAALDVEEVRGDFPILDTLIHGEPLVYFDNAATAQKPNAVIDAVSNYYRTVNSNVHRGVHTLSQRATDVYEDARRTVQKFLSAEDEREVIFTRGTTESINLVASSYGSEFLSEGDEIVVSHMEHHSNLVPWQIAAERAGATVRIAPLTEDGDLDYHAFQKLLGKNTRLVALTHVSNTLGTVVDAARITEMAHAAGAPILIDGAQAVPHQTVNVQTLDCDFYCFSAHKLFGPMGIGVLYAKAEWLERLPPYQSGGGMIDRVDIGGTSYGDLPHKFEAGTPNVAGAVGLAAAIDYVSEIGYDGIAGHEDLLTRELLGVLTGFDRIKVFGPAQHRGPVVSFLIDGSHPFDVGSLLDQMGIAVRTGHHCNQPLMDLLNIPGTVRASLAFYNTTTEIGRFGEGLERVMDLLS